MYDGIYSDPLLGLRRISVLRGGQEGLSSGGDVGKDFYSRQGNGCLTVIERPIYLGKHR